MKHLIIFISGTIFFQQHGFAAIRIGEPIPVGRFSIGFNFSPDLCYRTLINNDGSSSSDLVINQRNSTEVMRPGMTTGLIASWQFHPNVSISGGIAYSIKGYQTRVTMSTFGSGGTVESQMVYGIHYLELPFQVSVIYRKGKVSPVAQAGFSVNMFLEGKSTRKMADAQGNRSSETISGANDYNQWNLSPMLGAGVRFQLSQKIRLDVIPKIRYGVIKITQTPVTAYLWNTGLDISAHLLF